VRKHALTAAGILLAGLGLFLATQGGRAEARLVHTCSATDKAFISTAQVNLSSLSLFAQQYLNGDMKAADVVAQARQSADVVDRTEPRDPSLLKTRRLLNSMFNEYARAIQAKSKKRDAGPHMYRAYGLANFAHDVLIEARPELKRAGCDVDPLL